MLLGLQALSLPCVWDTEVVMFGPRIQENLLFVSRKSNKFYHLPSITDPGTDRKMFIRKKELYQLLKLSFHD